MMKRKADRDSLREIHRMVETVRYDKEVSLEYMKVYEREKMIREDGKLEGKIESEVGFVRKLSRSKSPEQTAELLEMDLEYVKRILSFIAKYPEENEKQIALRVLAEE